MNTHDFYFDLPQNLIARHPAKPRDMSRLLYLKRHTGEISHHHFYDLPAFLQPGDALIVNDSRVLPARLYGRRADTNSSIEFLLLNQKQGDRWEVLCKPGKRAKTGCRFRFSDLLEAEVVQVLEDGNRIIQFYYDKSKENIFSLLYKIGQMPLPPYIKEELKDKEQYQTVYSREIGSAAAPTAGLHFTPELLNAISKKGVAIGYVTLHVGLGTFRPVKVDDVAKHKMHAEHFDLPAKTVELIKKTKRTGNKVFAVGTTSCRTLESVGQKYPHLQAAEGWTDIFIYPGFPFRVIDGLITNFHLPESTLIMLVSAFAGYDHVMKAYETAVDERYRFFSFGDAMLIV